MPLTHGQPANKVLASFSRESYSRDLFHASQTKAGEHAIETLTMAKPEMISQIAKIRSGVRRDGECRVGCDELSLLCSNEVSPRAQLTAVNEIAQWEQWNFDFLADGRVRFFSSHQPPDDPL